MIALLVLAGILVLFALFAISAFNRLVALNNGVKSAWSDITVQLKRRYDLIPNLVETVKGYATHEKGTFEAVIQARNSAAAPHSGAQEQGQAENMLSGALRQLFALSESYPELKANTNFLELQGQLSEIEDTIQKARRYYNGSVEILNNMVQSFPSNLVARMFGFSAAEFFALDGDEAKAVQSAPKVSF